MMSLEDLQVLSEIHWSEEKFKKKFDNAITLFRNLLFLAKNDFKKFISNKNYLILFIC